MSKKEAFIGLCMAIVFCFSVIHVFGGVLNSTSEVQEVYQVQKDDYAIHDIVGTKQVMAASLPYSEGKEVNTENGDGSDVGALIDGDYISTPLKLASSQTKNEAVLASKTIGDEKFSLRENELGDYKKLNMTATAYDLSFQSCGKYPSHPQYGKTSSGLYVTTNQTVATDKQVIPTGSIVYIEFPDEYAWKNGIYRAEDTGVKGHIIDIYFGEDRNGSREVHNAAMNFGRRDVKVWILRSGW